jgi:hypothetical protein
VASRWPKHVNIVATIKGPEPPADDIRLFRPYLLAAYAKVCPIVTEVKSAIRALGVHSRLIMVRCGDEGVRGVRLVFTGVRMPDLSKLLLPAMQEPQAALAMLGLRWHITTRPAVSDAERYQVVEQRPAAGEIVPFGTRVEVVIAR